MVKDYKEIQDYYDAMNDLFAGAEKRITKKAYNKLFNKQGGRCIICGIHQSELNRKLSIDHSHKTGEIRGLLCPLCNSMLGFAKDNPEILKRAIQYLKGKL